MKKLTLLLIAISLTACAPRKPYPYSNPYHHDPVADIIAMDTPINHANGGK